MNPTVRQATIADLELVAPLFDRYRQFYGCSEDLELARRFTPDVFHGDLLLFTADAPETEDWLSVQLTPEAWLPYVDGELDLHAVATPHARMMQPAPLARIGPVVAAALAAATTMERP